MPDQNPSQAIAIGQKKADDVAARRAAARASRKQVLSTHLKKFSLNVSVTTPSAPGVTTAMIETAGYLIAAGDSWFDYPIHDVLSKLEDEHGYSVESSAHAGDPMEAMAYRDGQLDKFGRCLDKILAHGTTPKAVLLSGGGDDIAGDEFGMLINNATSPISGWNNEVVDGVINDRVATAYRVMIAAINKLMQDIAHATPPVLVHGYDYPVPDGRGFLGGWLFLPGPWLKPGFQEKLFKDLPVTVTMMHDIIDRFNAMLQKLAQDPMFKNVHYVDVRKTLASDPATYKNWWANELHPTGNGFSAVANRFAATLAQLP